mgnify:FL=1
MCAGEAKESIYAIICPARFLVAQGDGVLDAGVGQAGDELRHARDCTGGTEDGRTTGTGHALN